MLYISVSQCYDIHQRGDCLATKKQRYMISVDDAMFREIEDFRYEKCYPTRSEATSELIRLGLEVIKEERRNAETRANSQKE